MTQFFRWLGFPFRLVLFPVVIFFWVITATCYPYDAAGMFDGIIEWFWGED